MNAWASKKAISLFGILLLLAGGLGCGGGRSHSDFLPPEDKSRQALEAALTAWQNGQKAGRIESFSPPIQVEDSKWKVGHRLQSFQIVRLEPGEGPERFLVKLTMKQPPGELEVRYLVLGLDPLWVCREEDYKKIEGKGM